MKPEVKRLGVLGGSFDPVHLAHLLVAETVREALALDLVLFVPTGVQPLKQGRPVTPAEHRIEMLELATHDNPCFGISRADVDREGPSYTVDTVRHLRETWGGDGLQMWFIIGADSLASFPMWRDPSGILSQTRLAVVGRPGVSVAPATLEEHLPGIMASVDMVDAPMLEISATDIRQRVATGRSIRYRVPGAVREYIEAKGLYRDVRDSR
ncbi:MAG TPA: nicotinate-nucleotide adenylyltransferase [Chloroflexia bacterium]|jgi:nicotinate-nucleotide adenylyltransferase|nr:nicotinate-nucleotide adenylyltransferase [Chloroflexia bacterium]